MYLLEGISISDPDLVLEEVGFRFKKKYDPYPVCP